MGSRGLRNPGESRMSWGDLIWVMERWFLAGVYRRVQKTREISTVIMIIIIVIEIRENGGWI